MNTIKNYINRVIRLSPVLLVLLASCKKDDVPVLPESATKGITAVVNNNFSLSLFGFALNNTHYSDTLAQQGPYTVICPTNTAFTNAGYGSNTAVVKAATTMQALLPYLVLNKDLKLASLPLAFNQLITMSDGGPAYFSHWQNSRDTAWTINGIRIIALDKKAVNGWLNTVDILPAPISFKNVQEAVSGDASLSFFNAAIIRSGLATELQAAGSVFTVFAPVNDAFYGLGIGSVDQVYQQDPEAMKKLVKAHLINSRNFVYDYIMKADVTTNKYEEKMADGSSVTMMLMPGGGPSRFQGIALMPASGLYTSVTKQNVPALNGVVHSINNVLNQ